MVNRGDGSKSEEMGEGMKLAVGGMITASCARKLNSYRGKVDYRAPERWERWERVPSQFEILEATFGKPAEIASEISVQ